MTFKEKLRQAARDAKACEKHYVVPTSLGGSASLCRPVRPDEHVPALDTTAIFCDACADALVCAVLDEFVRKPSTLALSAFASSCWEREAVEKILQAQRKSCND